MLPDEKEYASETQSLADPGDIGTVDESGEVCQYLDNTLSMDPLAEEKIENQEKIEGEEQIEDKDDWNVSTAARYFGKSPRQIQRLLKAGLMKGYKIQGPKGPEWRVCPQQLEQATGIELSVVNKLCEVDVRLAAVTEELQRLNAKAEALETTLRQLQGAGSGQSDFSGEPAASIAGAAVSLEEFKQQKEQTRAAVNDMSAQRDEVRAQIENQARAAWWQRAYKQ